MIKKEIHKYTNAFIKSKSYTPHSWDGESQIVMVNGVPVTAMIYDSLARYLIEKLPVKVILIDLVGTGGSYLKDRHYSWTAQRTAMEKHFKTLGKFTLLVHDAAGPVLLPLLSTLSNIEKVIILNTVIKPSKLKPPFPLNVMQKTAIIRPFAPLTPAWYYRQSIRKYGIDRKKSVSNRFLNDLFKATRKKHGMTRLARVMKGFELTEESDKIIEEGIKVERPTLVVWAEKDPVLGSMFEYLEPILNCNSTTVRFPKAKHFFMLDYAEELSSEIIKWFRN